MTKAIRASAGEAHTTCDVCGRTLLRGERAQPYLEGGNHRSVCELCTARATQAGWIREGTMPSYNGRDSTAERGRGMLGRLRRRREDSRSEPAEPELLETGDSRRMSALSPRTRSRIREPRHVRAIPTSPEHKVIAAVDAFNGSHHPRTIAGVGRSLGLPTVSIRPNASRPSLVNVVVAWELCWYRYEVDLAEEDHDGVRVAAQGDELTELTDEERTPNAFCDEHGALSVDE